MLLASITIAMAARSLPKDAQNSLYPYQPNVPVAIIAVVSFAIVTFMHLWLFTRYQAWHFWAMYIGLFVELVGFAARAITAYNPTNVHAFLISYLALILGPSFMAAACYATFGRIVWWVTPAKSHRIRLLWFPPRFVTPIFVFVDLGSFLIQLLGAGAVGTAYANKELSAKQQQDQATSGLAALKLGFALQLLCFGLFVVVGTRFLLVSRHWTTRPLQYRAPLGTNWTRLNWTVSIAMIAITVRAVYRMVEFSSDSKSNLHRLLLQEWPFWVFDAIPMLGVFVIFAVVYPGQHLPLEFRGWWLNTRKLRKQAQSSPPHYSQATLQCLSRETGNTDQRVWI